MAVIDDLDARDGAAGDGELETGARAEIVAKGRAKVELRCAGVHPRLLPIRVPRPPSVTMATVCDAIGAPRYR